MLGTLIRQVSVLRDMHAAYLIVCDVKMRVNESERGWEMQFWAGALTGP